MNRGVLTPDLKLGLLVFFVFLVLSSCAGGGGGGSEQAEQAKARAIPTAQGKSLSAGRYTTEEFDPALSFSVGKGWHAGVPEGTQTFGIGQEGGSLYIAFWNVQKVFDSKNPNSQNLSAAPDDMAAWLQEHPNVDAEQPEEVTIGGVSGVHFDTVASPVPQEYPPDCGEPCVPLFAARGGEGPISNFGLFESEKLRFIVLDDVEGETVTIAVGGRAVDFEEFIPRAQKVLDTVEWEGT